MMVLIGFLLPALIDLINRRIANTDVRFWVSVLICAVVGAGYNFIERNGIYTGMTMLDIAEVVATSIMAIFGIAQLSYKALWEDSSVRNNLGLNAKTNDTV